MKRVLIVAPYPFGKAPSQRFRFEQFLDAFEAAGIRTEFVAFWAERHWPAIYSRGGLFFKIGATLSGFLRRFFLLFRTSHFDAVFIHREATPVGPPWWERAVAKIWRKPIIYDFDDAVWLPNNSAANEKIAGRFKAHGKTARIIGMSRTVTAGNDFLAEYARSFCSDVCVIPTTVDTEKRHNRIKKHGNKAVPVIGWTGSHSTVRQLVPIFPLLEEIHKTQPFEFLLISDIAPQNAPDFVTFCKWRKETEIEDLLKIDIGIMPLFDTDWERGKCGFKAVQYSALGIPSVVSDVGVNRKIVRDGATGFLCESLPFQSAECWKKALTRLLRDRQLRADTGAAARKHAEDHYSVRAVKAAYTTALKGALED